MLSRDNKKTLTSSQAMSLQKQKPQPPKPTSTALSTIFKPMQSGDLSKSSTVQECVSVQLGTDPVFDSTDPTVMLRYPVVNMTSSQKKRILQISYLGNSIVQYTGQDFLPKYGLMVQNVVGYTQTRWDATASTWNIQATNVVAYSYPKQVNSFVKDGTGIVHYNVLYQLPAGTSWQIGSLSELVFKIVDDKGVPVAGPFNSVIQLEFRILHVGM